jgi:multiple antibiotic resistance protein
MGQTGGEWPWVMAVLGLLWGMILVTYLFLLASPPIERMLGRT